MNVKDDADKMARGHSANLATWPIQLGFANSIAVFVVDPKEGYEGAERGPSTFSMPFRPFPQPTPIRTSVVVEKVVVTPVCKIDVGADAGLRCR